MRDHRHILAAHEKLSAKPPPRSADDNRVGSTYNRRGRGIIREQYRGVEIVFYPPKFWPAIVGVSIVTLRNWLNREIIVTQEKYGMHVMCMTELHALKECVAKWYKTRDMHNAIEPEFRDDLRAHLQEARIALETFRRNLPLSPRMRTLLTPDIKDI